MSCTEVAESSNVSQVPNRSQIFGDNMQNIAAHAWATKRTQSAISTKDPPQNQVNAIRNRFEPPTNNVENVKPSTPYISHSNSISSIETRHTSVASIRNRFETTNNNKENIDKPRWNSSTKVPTKDQAHFARVDRGTEPLNTPPVGSIKARLALYSQAASSSSPPPLPYGSKKQEKGELNR